MTLRFHLLLLAWSLIVACPEANDDDSRSTDCTDLAAMENMPEVTLSAPPSSTIYSISDDIPVIGTVADEGTAPTDIGLELFDVIDVEPEPVDVDVPTADASGGFSFSIPGDDLGQGQHVLRLLATDPDGCTGWEEVFFCIDTVDCLGG